MRIEKIEFQNFRKFIEGSIEFSKKDTDLHVIIAENGVGKTTFLNAITWCLYDLEPKIEGNEEESYTILNSKISKKAKDDDEIPVSVIITVSNGKDKLKFEHENIFKINSVNSEYYENNGFREELIDENFVVTVTDEKGNSDPISDRDEFDNFVSSFIPKDIQEFFFFDSERLENYFFTNSNIEEQTEKLSHIKILSTMKNRISTIIGELDDSIEKDEKSEKYYNEYLEFKGQYDDMNDDLTEQEKEYQELSLEYNDLVNRLKIPSVSKLEKERDKKNENIDKTNIKLDEKKYSLNDHVILNSPKIFSKEAIENCLKIIDENKLGETSYIDEKYLESSIHEKKCILCDTDLDESLIERIQEKIIQFYSIPPEIKRLNEFENIFKQILKSNNDYMDIDKDMEDTITVLEDNILEIEEARDNLQNQIDKIIDKKDDTDRRDELEELIPIKKQEFLSTKSNLEKIKEEMDNKYEQYQKALNKELESEELKNKLKLLRDAKLVVQKTYDEIMADTRKSIEKLTNDNFDSLIRKTEVFDRIELDENYHIKLYDGDRLVTFSASATERQLIALSFALAVHSISNYVAPLIVDNPFLRPSGKNRVNVAQSCFNLSKDRQMILILIEEEYTDNVKKVFNSEGEIKPQCFKESEDELEVKIGGC